MSPSKPCELTVLLPCLDEAATIESCVRDARTFLEQEGVRGEVLVADNGSTDGSQELARQAGARVVEVAVRGYGAALREGALAAAGRYIVMADSDESYDVRHVGPFLERLRAGADLVMGNRFAGGIRQGAMPWLNRYLGNPILSFVGRLFFKTGIRDFHCGIRGITRQAFDRLDLQTTGMEFASEMVVKASLLGLRIEEVPTTLSPDGRGRPPHLRRWRDGWRHLRFMLLYSPRWLFFYPGGALATLGLGATVWLLPGPRNLGGVVFDVHTLLFASGAMIVGVQSMLFAILTKVYADREGLLPLGPVAAAWVRRFQLEAGVAIGGLLALLGFGAAVAAVLVWERVGFGELDPGETLRLVIPAVTASVIGLQVALGSFFLSVLRLSTRRSTWSSPEPLTGR